jgi:hypothetical protein
MRPDYKPMIQNREVKDTTWTPYREVVRYRRLLCASIALNVILAAALLRVIIFTAASK